MPAAAVPARGRTALVTGASGHVGVNLVRRLGEQGWRVRTFSRHPFRIPGVSGTEHVSGDLGDPAATARAVEGVDVVFNLAAKIALRTRDDEAWAVNAAGTAVVARSALAAGVGRLVHCSSVQAFDIDRCGPRLDEHSPRAGPGRPVYDRSKAAGEDALRALAADGFDVVIVNPTGIVGPVDLGTARSNSLLGAAARGHLPLVIAGGSDFVDVRDVVDAMIAAVELGRSGENYVLSGHRATLLHIARMAAGLNGRLGPLLALPAGVCRWLAPLGERVGAVVGSDVFTPASIDSALSTVEFDHSKATRDLGYVPRPLEETVLDLLEWMRADGQLDPPGAGAGWGGVGLAAVQRGAALRLRR